jgi:hypothetical protein
MCRHSQYFRDLYIQYTGNSATSEHGTVVLEGVSSFEMQCLLAIVYPRCASAHLPPCHGHSSFHSDFNTCSLTNKDEWAAVLRLAHVYTFPSVRALAIRNLDPLASAVDKIVFGHAYGIEHWLLDAYVAVCVRQQLLSLEEGERLGARDLVTIAHARKELENRALVYEDAMGGGGVAAENEQEVRYIVWRTCCPALDVPDLTALHKRKLAEAADPLHAAETKVVYLQAELRRKKAWVDVATSKLDEACAVFANLQKGCKGGLTGDEAAGLTSSSQTSIATKLVTVSSTAAPVVHSSVIDPAIATVLEDNSKIVTDLREKLDDLAGTVALKDGVIAGIQKCLEQSQAELRRVTAYADERSWAADELRDAKQAAESELVNAEEKLARTQAELDESTSKHQATHWEVR